MAIKTYNPAVSVTLLKNVANDKGSHKRYTGRGNRIDLTPWLGDGGEVTTSRSVDGSPGHFSITLTDRMDRATQDSIYSSVHPMDAIEIRMSGEPHKHTGLLPIIMRGFVTRIRRVETMVGDGRPVRSVLIQGIDHTKAFLDYALFLWRHYPSGEVLISGYEFITKSKLDQGSLSLQQFAFTIVFKFINEHLRTMFGIRERGENENPTVLGARIGKVPGHVIIQGLPIADINFWSLLRGQCDLAWNECYITDEEGPAGDLPFLVLRAKPYRSFESGDLIMPNATPADRVSVDHRDIVSLDMSRSDVDVANLYWVASPILYYLKDQDFRANEAAKNDGSMYMTGHDNNSPRLYADRLMQASTTLAPVGNATPNLPAGELAKVKSGVHDWVQMRRLQLQALNQDNSVFEEGTLTCRGNEGIRPGMDLMIKRGGLEFDCYVQRVTQRFVPFRQFTTTVGFDRGTGFRSRSRLASSPYIGEIGKGV